MRSLGRIIWCGESGIAESTHSILSILPSLTRRYRITQSSALRETKQAEFCSRANSLPYLTNSSPRPRVTVKQLSLNKEISTAALPSDILDLVEKNIENVSRVNLVTALHRIAKKHKQLYKFSSGKKLSSKINQCLDYRLFRIIFALHKDLIDCRKNGEPSWSSRDLCNTLWSLATLSTTRKPTKDLNSPVFRRLRGSVLLFEDILNEIVGQNVSSLHPQHVGMSLWAIAKTYKKDNKTLKQVITSLNNPNRESLTDTTCLLLINLATVSLSQCTPQHIANISWALAKLQQPSSVAFLRLVENGLVDYENRVSHQCRSLKDTNSVQDNKLPAIPHKNADFAYGLGKRESRTSIGLSSFDNQSLSNFLWSMATTGTLPSEDFLRLFTNVFANRYKDSSANVNEQNVSNILWSIAQYRTCLDEVERHFSSETTEKSTFKYDRRQQSSSNVGDKEFLSSVDPGRHMEILGSFFEAGMECIYLNREKYKFLPLELSNIMWSLGTFYKSNGAPLVSSFAERSYSSHKIVQPVLELLCMQTSQESVSFCSQNIGNTLWGLAKLGQQNFQVHNVFLTFDHILTRSLRTPKDSMPKKCTGAKELLGSEIDYTDPPEESESPTLFTLDKVYHTHTSIPVSGDSASTSHDPSEETEKVSSRFVPVDGAELSQFNWQELANVLWAFASLRFVPSAEFLHLYAAAYSRILEDFKFLSRDSKAPDQITMTIWAMVQILDVIKCKQLIDFKTAPDLTQDVIESDHLNAPTGVSTPTEAPQPERENSQTDTRSTTREKEEQENHEMNSHLTDIRLMQTDAVCTEIENLCLLLARSYSSQMRIFTRRQKSHIQSSLSLLITLLPGNSSSINKIQNILDKSSW